jgi:hypothetical protein
LFTICLEPPKSDGNRQSKLYRLRA